MEVTWVTSDGLPLTGPEPGAAGEIVEYDSDGMVMRRTYGRIPNVGETPRLQPTSGDDAHLEAAATDAMKRTWDVTRPGDHQLVTTFIDLVDALDLASLPFPLMRETVAGMLVLPSWQDAPEQLRQEVADWLMATMDADQR